MRKEDLKVGGRFWAVLGKTIEEVKVVSFDEDTVCLLLVKAEKLTFHSYKRTGLFFSEQDAKDFLQASDRPRV